MTIDKKFIDQFINVTSKAALASSYLVGKKDKIKIDQVAVDSMRLELNKINMSGEIVIGEDSWIGAGVVIQPGIKIGKRCIVGSMSNVNKDIPDDYLAYGNPVRLIRKIDVD